MADTPSSVRAHAPSARRTTAVSSSSATGSEARSAQSSAAAVSGGGTWSRVAGLNAQPRPAPRRRRAWYRDGSPSRSCAVRMLLNSSIDDRR